MTNFINDNKIQIFFILFMLLLFHGLNNYYILTKSRYCLDPDSVSYFVRISRTLQIFKNVELNLKSLYETYNEIFRDNFKPPLFFITASSFLLFGSDKNTIIMSNLIYFAILLFATYGIGEKLYNYKVGILSAFLVSMFPTVFALSRVLIVDFALAAMVALTFYLFALDKFDSLKFSLLTGIVIGLGSLIKQSYFLFLLPILFYFFLRKNNLKNKKILRNFILSIAIGLFISSFYYIRRSYDYYHVIFQVKSNINPLYYLQSTLNYQLLPLFSLLFLISILFCFKKKRYFLPVMVLIIVIIFSISPNKQIRFTLPILPFIAVIISGFLWSLEKIRRPLIASLVLFSFLQYFVISYRSNSTILYNFSKNLLFNVQQQSINTSGLLSIIDEGDWEKSCEEIIKIVSNNKKRKNINETIKILFLGQNWKIWTTIRYQQLIKALPIELNRTHIDSDFLYRFWTINKDFNNEIFSHEIIIIEEIHPEDMWIHYLNLLNTFKRNSGKYKFIKTIVFPDNSKCYIYRKIPLS